MVDTNLKYNGRNSFRIAKGDPALQSWIQDVIPNESVVVQAVVISSGIEHTGVRMGCSIFWLDADNKIIFPVQTQYFDIMTIWELYWMTKQAPANAQRVFVSFFIWGDITDSAINIAEPKLGRGELPTSFTPDDYERTQYMSIGGNYLSYIKADQVQTGILISADTLAGFDLDKPEIWMTGNDGSKWTASPENPLEITDAKNNFIGGLAIIAAGLALIASAISNEEDPTVWLDVGSIADGSAYSDGLRLFHKAWSTAKGMFEVIPEGSTAIPTVLVKILENLCNIRAVDNPGISRARVIAALSSLSILADRTSDGESAAITIDGNRTYSNPSSGPVQTQMGLQMVSPKSDSTTRKIAIYAYDKNNVRTEIGIDADGPYKKVDTVRTAL